MSNRYIFTNRLIQKETKKSYYESTIYPKVTPSDNDLYVIAVQGDRLDVLANKYYGDPKMWWIIATANNLNDATLSIEPGKQLRIPSDTSTIINNLQRINK